MVPHRLEGFIPGAGDLRNTIRTGVVGTARARRTTLVHVTTDVEAAEHGASTRETVLSWLVLLGRLALGGVWIVAGALKVTDLDASVRAVRAYRLLPDLVAQIVGAALPMVEIVVGLLLVVGLAVRLMGLISAVLMAAFIVGISSAWARGLQIDCGCFGSGGLLAAGEKPTYGLELTRDVALFLVALLVAWRPSGRFAIDGRMGSGKGI